MEGVHEGWGAKVRKRRESIRMSQDDLAIAADISQATLSRIELGLQVPSDNVKWRLCGVLGCTLDDLFPWPAVVPPVPEPRPEPAPRLAS